MPTSIQLRCCAILFVLALLPSATTSPCVASDQDLSKASALLNKHCLECHGPDLQEGNLRIDKLNTDLVAGDDADRWHEVLNRINVGEMPPEDEPQLSADELQTVTGWLNAELKRAAKARQANRGVAQIRRLNRSEYGNTMRDLFGMPLNFEKPLPPDGLSAAGFLNDSEKPTTLPSVSPVKGEVTALEPAAIADAPSTESDFMQVAASSTVLTSLSLPTAVATASVDQLLASPAAGAIVMASAQASNGIRVAPTAPPQGKMQQTDASGIEAPQAGSPKADGILAGSQIEPEAASRLNLESGSVNDFNSTKSGAQALAPSDQSTGAVAQNTSSGATPSQTSSVATNSSSQPSLVQNLSNVTQLQFNQTDSASLELGVEPQLSDDLQAFSRTEVRIDPAALSQAGRSSAPQLAQLSGQIGDQILHRFNGQSSKFEMRLDPPELGKVDVRLEVGKDGRVTAVLAARDPAVVEALMRGAKTLENTLTQAGLSLSQGGVQVELDQRGSGQQFSNLMNQNDSHQDRQTGQQLQNGDAEISDVEAPMAPAADQPIQFQSWSRARLDVKA